MKNIILYTEDIPVKEGVVSTGLSRVNSYFINNFSKNLIFSFLFNKSIKDHYQLYNKVDKFTLSKSNLSHHGSMFKFFSFMLLLFIKVFKFNVDRYFLFILKLSFKKMSLPIEKANTIVFAPIGVDYSAIRRAKLLADSISVPLVLYLVDDPIANMSVLGIDDAVIRDAEIEFSLLLFQAANVITITDGLRDRLYSSYGILSYTMGLPYIEKSVDFSTFPFFTKYGQYIVFVGNSSHFYQDGLNELCALLAEEYNNNIKLVFTIPSKFVSSLEARYPGVVFVNACKSEDELGSLVNQALFSFLPYSFTEKYKNMVSTSFPSKFLDYCSWAKRVLVYAPAYSVSAKLFDCYNLAYSVTTNDKRQLAQMINKIISENHDHSSSYLSYLRTYHINYNFTAVVTRDR